MQFCYISIIKSAISASWSSCQSFWPLSIKYLVRSPSVDTFIWNKYSNGDHNLSSVVELKYIHDTSCLYITTHVNAPHGRPNIRSLLDFNRAMGKFSELDHFTIQNLHLLEFFSRSLSVPWAPLAMLGGPGGRFCIVKWIW